MTLDGKKQDTTDPSVTHRRLGLEEFVVVGFFVAVLIVTSVVLVKIRDDPSANPRQDQSEVVHVHGMGINPQDDRLYAASHRGLFRIDGSGVAVRIGDRHQDTMGFTVVGPDRFLASGHPDLRESALQIEGKPPLLGLIESTDAGASWTPLSLLGEADFHSVAVVDGLIIAYDSTGSRLLVSPDGSTWETRSEEPLVDLAVKPGDATLMAAIDLDGTLLRSSDGGRTWVTDQIAPVGGSVVRWGPAGIWLGGEDGLLHRNDPTSRQWLTIGRFDSSIEALLITESGVYVAVSEQGILQSNDQGQGWTVVFDGNKSPSVEDSASNVIHSQ